MPKFWVEEQPWQRWPKVLVMHRENDKGFEEVRKYLPYDEVIASPTIIDRDGGLIVRCNCGCTLFERPPRKEDRKAPVGSTYPLYHVYPNYCPQCGAKMPHDNTHIIVEKIGG